MPESGFGAEKTAWPSFSTEQELGIGGSLEECL
jgi:hypothetical protein